MVLALPLVAAPTISRAQATESSTVTVATTGSSTVFTCGSSYNGVAVICNGASSGGTTRPVRAAEIDLAFAASGVVFVLGCLAILRGRKRF
jgi:hypothetical protein